MKPNRDVQIRWMIRRDMPEILDIERNSFTNYWCDDDFLSCMRQRNCIGMVAEREHKVVGFMIYKLHFGRLQILNFAVAPEYRRNGVGAAMIQRLFDKLTQQRRNEIRVMLRETNVPGQLFFRAMGFRAVAVDRAAYEDTDEDGFHFVFRLGDRSVEPRDAECGEGKGK